MGVKITTIHSDPGAGVLPILYCRCGQAAIENPSSNLTDSMDYKCPEGHGWVGNVISVEG